MSSPRPTPRLTDRQRVDIECALARGRSDGWIRDRYQVRQSVVEYVRAYLEELNDEPDTTPRRRDAADEAVRAETAAVYSTTVPEWHGHAVERPAGATAWERARLERAAHALTRRDERAG